MLQPKNVVAAFGVIGLMAIGGVSDAVAEGKYVSLQGGRTFLLDSTISGSRDDLGVTTDAVKLSDANIVSGAIGYSNKADWRFEGEATWQQFDVDQILDVTSNFVTGEGDIDVFGVGFNGFYEFRSTASVTPYIGAGLGAVYLKANDVRSPGRSTSSEEAFAPRGQAMVGVDFDVSEDIALTLGYRLQGIGVISASHTKANGSSFDGQSENIIYLHNVTAGLRFSF